MATTLSDTAYAKITAQQAAARAMLAALQMATRDLGAASSGSPILEVIKVGPLARTIDRAIAAAEAAGITAEG